MIRPWLEKTSDEFDAIIFTGDSLFEPEEFAFIKERLARWNRAVAEHEADNQPEAWEVAANENPLSSGL